MTLEYEGLAPEVFLCVGLGMGVPCGRGGPPRVPGSSDLGISAFLPEPLHEVDQRKEARLDTVITWVKAHPVELHTNMALFDDNI